jgi:sugar-specific transcriptional regulator TrmB
MVGSKGRARSGRGPAGGRRAERAGEAASVLAEALAPFGFAEYDARAYAALLERQPATAYEVAKRAGIADSKVYRALERLTARGVVTAVDREPRTFAALSPEALLGRLEASARRGLHGVRLALERLSHTEPPVAAWPLAGGAAVLDRAAALLAAAGARVELSCHGAPLAALAAPLAAARERGVEVVVAPPGPGGPADALVLVADAAEALVARLTTGPDGRLEGRGLASREGALVAVVTELLARRRGDERAAPRPAAASRARAAAVASPERALAPGRLDIC